MAEASRSDNSEIEIVIQSRSLRFRYEAGRRSSAPIIGKMNTTISTIQLNNYAGIFVVLISWVTGTNYIIHLHTAFCCEGTNGNRRRIEGNLR